MQAALEGNSKIAIICTISPANNFYEDSMSTLCFAMRAKSITQQVQRNELINSDKALIIAYEREIKALQEKLRVMELRVLKPGNLESSQYSHSDKW